MIQYNTNVVENLTYITCSDSEIMSLLYNMSDIKFSRTTSSWNKDDGGLGHAISSCVTSAAIPGPGPGAGRSDSESGSETRYDP